jgi:tRNA-dihydrouridine synthase B
MQTVQDRLSRPLSIGPVQIRNRVVLAPMSGVTDLPFRRLAYRFGAGMVVTEMIASRELAGETAESRRRLMRDGDGPHVVQLAGREAFWMAEAARIAEAEGADMIDINMGCPAKKVIGGYSGSALMRDPDHALTLIEATVNAVRVPVTLKMRLGWDETSINAPAIARRAEAAGVRMITIHGRTRCQFYRGRADWPAIAAVRDAITVPLIANGDVETVGDCDAILRQSGADAVMVGRAAQGRPWLVGMLAGSATEPSRQLRRDVILEHYEAMLSHYGVAVGIRHARKHLGSYLNLYAENAPVHLKTAIMTGTDARAVAAALSQALDEDFADQPDGGLLRHPEKAA